MTPTPSSPATALVAPRPSFKARWLASVRVLLSYAPFPVRYPLSKYRWGRKLLGGKWEYWWVDVPVASSCWHDVDEWTVITGIRPTPLCRGRARCEEDGIDYGILRKCKTCAALYRSSPFDPEWERTDLCWKCFTAVLNEAQEAGHLAPEQALAAGMITNSWGRPVATVSPRRRRWP